MLPHGPSLVKKVLCAGRHTREFRHPDFAAVPVHVASFKVADKLLVYSEMQVGDTRRRHQAQLDVQPLHAAVESCDTAGTAVAAGHATYQSIAAAAHDSVAMWSLNALHALHGKPPAWGLAAVPEPVLLAIMKHLGADDLCACARVCKALRAAADTEQLWQERLLADHHRSTCARVRSPSCQVHARVCTHVYFALELLMQNDMPWWTQAARGLRCTW